MLFVALARDRDGLRDQMPVYIALLLVEEASNALVVDVLEYRGSSELSALGR